VLGCGIDRDYPRAHASLAAAVAQRGLILSEYAPGVEPAPWRFPARNRIVAGLCDATVVVEARERSGALITADLALDEGREVLAVPGEITSHLSRGTNHLLRLGATPVTGVDDVLRAIGLGRRPPEPPTLAPRLAAVFEAVADAPAGADEIAARTSLAAAETAAALMELELLGVVRESDGVYRATGGGP
jgi:DNA processing protein